jgi:hypothetical protein
MGHNVVHHQSVPNEQRKQRADGRADQAGTRPGLQPVGVCAVQEIVGRHATRSAFPRPESYQAASASL